MSRQRVIHGDSSEVLRELDSVDVVVTDPPHKVGTGFMGSAWDKERPEQVIWNECFRVLKPGGHIWVMCSERVDCVAGFYLSLREAGFEVDNHQLIGWVALSGMPKSCDVSKLADKEAFRAWLKFVGADLSAEERRKAESTAVNGEWIDPRPIGGPATLNAGKGGWHNAHRHGQALLTRLLIAHWPSSPAEQRAHWEAVLGEVPEGWDTSRPPGVRVKTGEGTTPAGPRGKGGRFGDGGEFDRCESNPITAPSTPDAARFDGWRGSVAPLKPLMYPILHAVKPWQGSYLDCARETGGGVLNVDAGMVPFAGEDDVDEVRGRSGGSDPHDGFLGRCGREHGETFEPNTQCRVPGNLLSYGDLLGSLQKYADLDAWCAQLGLPAASAELLEAGLCYCPKPSKAEKNRGLPPDYKVKRNPCAKPVALCAYLIALSTREGDTVLDPFCGEAPVGVAATLLGRSFVGIEMEADFCKTARSRILHAQLVGSVA